MNEQFISTKEFCTILSISPSTVYRMIWNHTIPAVKFGKNWKIPASVILNLQTSYNKQIYR